MGDRANKAVVMDVLESLVREKNLRALSISGPWGVGKTHLIHEFAKNSSELLREAKLKFVYVSLFGLTSLQGVRSRIAASSLSPVQLWLAHIPLIARIGWVDMSKVGDIARDVAEKALLKNLFVVIDDLERAGEDLSSVSVVGLISELIEQCGCKCVLILNKEKLAKQINQMEEKVFDLTLDYRPMISDVLTYGLPREEDCMLALPVFEAFDCANIRIAKRLSWILRELGSTSYTQAEKIWPTIVRQATVLAIMKYEYGYDRAKLNQVVERTESARLMKQVAKELGEQSGSELPQKVTAVLDKIDYTDAGFGAFIIDLLEKGTLDHPALALALADCAGAELHVAQTARFHGFFQEMHTGFGASAIDFAARIATFLEEELARPDRFNLFYLCDLLVRVDPSERSLALAAKKLQYLVSPITPDNREKNLKEALPHLWATKVFDRIPYKESKRTLTLAECFDVAVWEPESVAPMMASLVQFPEPEWVDYLLGLRADNTMQLIRRFRAKIKQGEGLPSQSLPTIQAKFENVLQAIAARDPLFRIKIEDYTDPAKKPGPF
jgi:hypothetical protein